MLAPSPADIPKAAPVRAHQGRLFRKYLLVILAPVTVILLASGWISFDFSSTEIKSGIAGLQHEKAVAAASRIEQYIRQISQQLAYAALPQVDAGDVELRRIEFLKLLRQAPEVTDIAQLDAAGRERIAVSRLGMDRIDSGMDRSQEPAFRNAKRGQPWHGPVYFRKETEPYMTIAMRSGGDAGPVTVADVNLKFIWDVVSRIKIGDKGKAYVVDGNGFLIADPDIGLVLRKTDLSNLPHVKAARAGQDSAELAMLSVDLAGTPVLTSFAPIESLDWMVFVEQPAAMAYEKLNSWVRNTQLLLLAGLVISGIGALWLARSMVRPIRTLDEGARRIGAGDLEQQIVVRTGDELEGLADQFNRMTAQLRESYAGLERKVDERTTELTNSLEQQTAISEILRVISNSPTDVQPVLDAVAERALNLCDAAHAVIALVEGTNLRFVAGFGSAQDAVGEVVPLDRGLVAGRAVLERTTIHLDDLAQVSEDDYPAARKMQARIGHHTVLAVPLIREDHAIGAIALWRMEIRPFSDKETWLVKTFADQAGIAIDNVRLFREIQDKSRELETANKHKSEFLANMSHELRTPLNAIIGFSEVLLERLFGELNAKQDDYLKDIHSSGRHLLQLINDILDLAKVEAGRMDLDPAAFDLPSAIANAMTLIRQRAQAHDITLALDADPGLGEITADERKFKQILLNLLSNAVKFTPDGGRIEVSARRDHDNVVVAVHDTGIGIAAEDQEAVFEEFRQVGRNYTNKQEGTGLGLALTRKFVELHGGRIWLDSEPGKGSTFTFTIPTRL